MREIKFRAWDRGRSEMLPITSMNWSEWWVSCEPILEDSVLPLAYGDRNSFKNEDTDRHILMQYTGLKDRNGKEIYEGDIAESRIETVVYQIAWIETVATFGVKVSNTKNVLSRGLRFPMSYYVESGGYIDLTVIGNIYENPELLGGSEA